MNTQRKVMSQAVAAAMLCLAGSANAQVTVADDFTQVSNQVPWTVSGPACLTAGSSGGSMPSTLKAATSGLIPACSTSGQSGGYGDTKYPGGYMAAGKADPAGHGALRLTDAEGSQAGAIVYNSSFASNAGISITFTAVSYDGNSYTGADGGSNGADGLSFFLLDASKNFDSSGNYNGNIGQFGGSLGYSCAQGKGDGAAGGYIGLGIDEYGNFLNSGDNTATGVANTTGSFGQFQQNRIGVRGAGMVNWKQLNAAYPTQYPSTLTSSQQQTAVEKTCQTGTLWDYSTPSSPVQSGGTPVCNTYAQLNALKPTFYPLTLSSSDQSSAVTNTCNTGNAWDYSYSNSSPDYSSSGNPYNLGTAYTYAQLNAINSTYYPSGLSASDQANAVANTSKYHVAFDYSYSLTSPDFSTSGSPTKLDGKTCQFTTYAQLNAWNSTDYPTPNSTNGIQPSDQATAISSTCSFQQIYKWSTSKSKFTNTSTSFSFPAKVAIVVPSAVSIAQGTTPPTQIPDYNVITYVDSTGVTNTASYALSGVAISNETAGGRNPAGSNTGATEFTYQLTVSSNGLLSLSFTRSTDAPGASPVYVATNWPLFGTNGTLPTNFTFGFAGSTGGGTNVHEITCFQAAPSEDTDSSAAVNAVQAGQIRTNSAVYLAYYHTHDWWGQLVSAPLLVNSSTQAVSVGTTANWDASCVLTGDATLPGAKCAATGSTTDTATPTPTTRVMLTYDNVGNTGEAFEWTAATGGTAITSAQQTLLNDDTLGQKRLNYLRGDRTNEVNATTGIGPFRARVSVLGDIVNSSPTWIGAPAEYLPTGTWVDNLYPSVTQSETSYSSYQSTNSARLNVVYVGANDGFLHGFETGSYSSSTGVVTTPGTGTNDGKEIIAYMPAAVLSTIHNTTSQASDYTSPNFAHNYYVDATPTIGDLYFGSAWHSWLVGGLGSGGKAIYALDVTNPSSSNFTEANAASLVIGEWSTATAGLGNDLGQTYGTPVVTRLHTGKWAVIFGNGYKSHNGTGGVFVGQVDPTTGAVSFMFLSTPTEENNGVFAATAADLDGDGITDYIYAGDMLGNVWRWDVTGSDSTKWPATTPVKLFTTGSGQPITTQVQIGLVPNANGLPRVMIDFGTGEQLQSPSNPNSNTYATGSQALYGIWDGNMSAWNILNPANKYDPFPAAPGTLTLTQPYTVANADLQSQTTVSPLSNSSTGNDGTTNYRQITTNPVCWADGASTCSTYGTEGQYGWTYVLYGSNGSQAPEQVVFNPVIAQGVFVVNTYIASATQACTTANPTGWTIAIDVGTGASLPASYFVNSVGANEAAVQLGATGVPSFVSTAYGNFLVTNTSNVGSNGATNVNVTAHTNQNTSASRVNWSELR